jgi:signal transduction histidine kinase
MGAAIIFLKSRAIIAQRTLYENKKLTKKGREGTRAILEISGKAINADISDDAFLSSYCEYAQRSLGGDGAAVFFMTDDAVRGLTVSGVFPVLKDISSQIESQLVAHPKKHSEFIRDITIPFSREDIAKWCGSASFAFFKGGNFPSCFPEKFSKTAKRMVVAPIILEGEAAAAVMVVSGDDFDEHAIDENDCDYLAWLNEIASLSLKGIKIFREKRDYEKGLQQAKEEGMLQVSAGIIHNIGNAVTVAKLNVVELRDKNLPISSDSPESMILNEILPEIKRHIEKGDAGDFLSNDQTGSQFLNVISKLVSHISSRSAENSKLTKSLSNKLNHISEIIELQQRFIGELGTENLSSLAPVIESAVKIFEETFNKKSVSLKTEIHDNIQEILIDTSMMAQVYINLIKNAVEAMEAEKNDKEKSIKITLRTEEKDGRRSIISEVVDNGPGINPNALPNLFTFGFSTKEKSRHSRGYGLHSCKETVKKYGGTIAVDSKQGEGTKFTIIIPIV